MMIRSKKSGAKDLKEPQSALFFGERLINCEIHFAALDDFSGLYLVTSVTNGCKKAVLGRIDQNIAGSEEKDTRSAGFDCSVPTRAPKLSGKLKDNHGL